MSRRSARWLTLAVGVAAVAAFVLARRRQPTVAEPTAAGAADPGPVVAAATAAAAPTVAAPPADQVERPLPAWVRLVIVAAAVLAFFAVSLIMIATRNG